MAIMTSIDTLLGALPLTGVNIRSGSAGNCGGMMLAFIDVAGAPAYEFVNATPPPNEERYEDQELVDFCVANVRIGVEDELREHFGALPRSW